MKKRTIVNILAIMLVTIVASLTVTAVIDYTAYTLNKSAKVRRVNIEQLQTYDRNTFEKTVGTMKLSYSEQRDVPIISGSVVVSSWYKKNMPQTYYYNLIFTGVTSRITEGTVTTIQALGTEKYGTVSNKNVPVTITYDSDLMLYTVTTETTKLINIQVEDE